MLAKNICVYFFSEDFGRYIEWLYISLATILDFTQFAQYVVCVYILAFTTELTEKLSLIYIFVHNPIVNIWVNNVIERN